MEIDIDELKSDIPDDWTDDFQILEQIASGTFGSVMHGIETSTNREVAIKIINKIGARPFQIQKMKEEISILKQLQHDNIVKLYDYTETKNKWYIKMEYIRCGTLSTWITNNKGKINEADASLIISKILSAVSYLHDWKICHRDIKPENIMWNDYTDLTSVKLVDFGLSAQNFEAYSVNYYCGTWIYMAPEQIEKQLYTTAIDIWAVGIITFMLLNNGKHPYYEKGDRKKAYINKIKSKKIDMLDTCSYMAKLWLHKLLEINPHYRYTANIAWKHPWITRDTNGSVPETKTDELKRRVNEKCGKEILLIGVFLNHMKTRDVKKSIRPDGEAVRRQNQNILKRIKQKNRRRKQNLYFLMKDQSISSCNSSMTNLSKEHTSRHKHQNCSIVISEEEGDVDNDHKDIDIDYEIDGDEPTNFTSAHKKKNVEAKGITKIKSLNTSMNTKNRCINNNGSISIRKVAPNSKGNKISLLSIYENPEPIRKKWSVFNININKLPDTRRHNKRNLQSKKSPSYKWLQSQNILATVTSVDVMRRNTLYNNKINDCRNSNNDQISPMSEEKRYVYSQFHAPSSQNRRTTKPNFMWNNIPTDRKTSSLYCIGNKSGFSKIRNENIILPKLSLTIKKNKPKDESRIIVNDNDNFTIVPLICPEVKR